MTALPGSGQRLPHFIILGAQKSATTWLHHALRRHPQIFMLKSETPFFEDPDYGASSLEHFAESFRDAGPDQLIGIKRPTYLSKAECALRIARDVPDVKLLMLLRAPVQRAISATYHMMRMGLLSVDDPDAHLNDLLDRYAHTPDPHGVLHYGRYAHSIEQYAALFPEQHRLVMLQHEVADDATTAFNRACSFLGIVSASLADLDDVVNAGIYEPRKLRSMNWMSRKRFRIDTQNGRLFEPTNRFRGLALGVAQRVVQILPNAGQKQAKISPATRQRLQEFYRDDIEKLARLLGRDLSCWMEQS